MDSQGWILKGWILKDEFSRMDSHIIWILTGTAGGFARMRAGGRGLRPVAGGRALRPHAGRRPSALPLLREMIKKHLAFLNIT